MEAGQPISILFVKIPIHGESVCLIEVSPYVYIGRWVDPLAKILASQA